MKISKLHISFIVACSILAIINISFIIYFFNQPHTKSNDPIIIKKETEEKITEEDVKNIMSQAVNEVREDATANETSYMSFMLTFIGTMATLSGIAFTIYNFFQVSKVRDSVEQGIKDGLNKLGEEYEKRAEEKYSGQLRDLTKRLDEVEFLLGDYENIMSRLIAFYGILNEKYINKPLMLLTFYRDCFVLHDYVSAMERIDVLITQNKHIEKELLILKYLLHKENEIFDNNFIEQLFLIAKRLIELGVKFEFDYISFTEIQKEELESYAIEMLSSYPKEELIDNQKLLSFMEYNLNFESGAKTVYSELIEERSTINISDTYVIHRRK